jgi:Kdo2-lipid IVA lauroyltransferase/acyltransferase
MNKERNRKQSLDRLSRLLKPYASLPLSVLFFISDILVFPLMYHVVRYRRKVVRRNLVNSFPGKSLLEIKVLERRFYRHFCDTIQETIRMLAMSEKEAIRRMNYLHPDLLEDLAKKNKGVLVVLGHYGNWEFQSFFRLCLAKESQIACFNVYRPLRNKTVDELMKQIRSSFGNRNVTKNDTYRMVVKLRREGVPGIFGLISDQTPSGSSLHFWTNFLNQETAFLMGAERMAKQTGYAVVYADIQKRSRGYYETDFKLISDDPLSTAEFEITETCARMLEATIRRDPAFWLWTHKRWKHHRNDDVSVVEPSNSEQP